MTWIEVISDAVKIGLGALIGAAAAIIGSYQSHRYRIKEEYSTRRRDQLEKIMVEFDAACLAVLRIVSTLDHVLMGRAKGEFEWSAQRERVAEYRRQLNAVEAKITLLDFPNVARKVGAFRDSVLQFENVCFEEDESTERTLACLKGMVDIRDEVIPLFASAYREA